MAATAAETASGAPRVIVLRDRYVRGDAPIGARTMLLAEALTRHHKTDAHFQQCTTGNGRRATMADIGRAAITMNCLALDLDAPGHCATPEWRTELRDKIARVLEWHPGGYFYETANGARVVWRVEPFEIATRADAARWSLIYRATCEQIRTGGEITCDCSCGDFTRLFRLPYVRRDGTTTAPAFTLGDPAALGRLELADPPLDDAPRPPPVSRTADAPGENVSTPADSGAPRPFLFRQLLAERNQLFDRCGDGWLIQCPRDHLHTVGRIGDGSTILYAPNEGGTYGTIHCKHNACADATLDDWLQALDVGGRAHRLARITATYIDTETDRFVRVVCAIEAADGGARLPAYLRVYDKPRARWLALWEAAVVEPPDDLDDAADSDLRAACAELRGKLITLELEGDRVRMILPARGGDAPWVS